MSNLEELLKHYGVKGMKWGVRRDRNRPGGADGISESAKVKDSRGTIRKNLDSMRRERQWKNVLNDINKLTTKDINTVAKRVKLENELKTLSRKKGVGTKKDKADYLRREHMSDSELTRKVSRLRAKNGLHSAVRDASKEQREMGERIVNSAKSVGTKFALNKITNKRTNANDILDALQKPKDTIKNDGKKIQDEILKKINQQNNPSKK